MEQSRNWGFIFGLGCWAGYFGLLLPHPEVTIGGALLVVLGAGLMFSGVCIGFAHLGHWIVSIKKPPPLKSKKLSMSWLKLVVIGVLWVNALNLAASIITGTFYKYTTLIIGFSLIFSASIIVISWTLFSRIRKREAHKMLIASLNERGRMNIPSLAKEFRLKVQEVKMAIEDAVASGRVAGIFTQDGSEFITKKKLKEELFDRLK